MTRTPNELTDLPDRAPGSAPVDLLTDVLAAVRLAGAVFLPRRVHLALGL